MGGITKLWAESGHAKSNKWFGVVQGLSWYQLEMMFQNMLLCGNLYDVGMELLINFPARINRALTFHLVAGFSEKS